MEFAYFASADLHPASRMLNQYYAEWTETGAIVLVSGLEGQKLLCPRCNENLTRGTEHRCGDAIKSKYLRKKKENG